MLLDIQAIYQELIIHHFYDIMNKTYNRGDFLKMQKSDNFILHFGVLLHSSKIRMNLTRDNYSIIDKNNYTKRRDELLILLNWDKWKNQKEELEFDEFKTRVCPPGLKFEKEDGKLVLSKEYCNRYHELCLKNYDLNMKFLSNLNENDFNNTINKIIKKFKMTEINDLNNYASNFGIYMCVLDNYKQIYIGQTKTSFKERILQHWKNKPKFDKILFGNSRKSVISYDSYGALDTTRIFTICETNQDKIDTLEKRIVDAISKDYLCNRIGGGIHLNNINDHYAAINSMNLRKLEDNF